MWRHACAARHAYVCVCNSFALLCMLFFIEAALYLYTKANVTHLYIHIHMYIEDINYIYIINKCIYFPIYVAHISICVCTVKCGSVKRLTSEKQLTFISQSAGDYQSKALQQQRTFTIFLLVQRVIHYFIY